VESGLWVPGLVLLTREAGMRTGDRPLADSYRRIKQVGLWMLMLLLYACTLSAYAEDFDDLEGSEHSPTFTSAERKLFVDAVTRFKKHEIPNAYFNGAPFWLDDDHLVFPSRAYPGWTAQAEEPPRIVIYNVNTGEIKDSGYRGRLDCLNHLGDFMLRLPIKPEGLSFSPEKYRWFIGRWGQSMQEIAYDRWAPMPDYLCRYTPRGHPIHRYPPDELPANAAWVTSLLTGHGVLRNTVVREGEKLVDYLHLVKDDGTKIFIRNSPVRRGSLVFHPWSATYYENGSTTTLPTSLTPSGDYKVHSLPRLIRFWKSRHVTDAGGYGCRAGILWGVQKSRGLWRKQGVYLDTGTELIRVGEGKVTGPMITSPNGCNVFWGAFAGDSFKLDRRRHTVVTDICEGL